MEMDEAKIEAIFTKVIELSNDLKLSWEAYDQKKGNSFVTEIGEYSIWLTAVDSLKYSFSIRRKDSGVELGKLFAEIFRAGNNYNRMEELFKKVRRKALKIDEGLDDLLTNLSKL
jgi:hypothetical protein